MTVAKKTGKKTTKSTAKARKTSTAKNNAAGKGQSSGKKAGKKGNDATIAVNRRTAKDRRKPADRRKQQEPVAVERRKTPRRKVARRRQIDPTTCERDYTADEIEFMSALEEYKRRSGRMFPTCSEVLEVLRGLGYEKFPRIQPAEQFDSGAAAEHAAPTNSL